MTETWNATFDVKPQGSDTVGTMDNFIVATRQGVRERVAKEHLFDFTANSQQGLHKMGSARVWLSDTEPASPIPTAIVTETVGDEDKGRLWFVTSSGVPTGEIKIYDGSAWVSLTDASWELLKLVSTFADDLLTAIKTVDGTGSGLDADTVDGTHLVDINNTYTAGTNKILNMTVLDSTVNVVSLVTSDAHTRVTAPLSTIIMRRAGTVRTSFQIKKTSGTYAKARWYKNGVAWGTERSTTSATYETFTEDLTVAVGDFIHLEVWTDVTSPTIGGLATDIWIGVAETNT